MTATNRTATRRTVSALRRADRLPPELAGLVRLAETTAGALDEILEGDEKRYVVAQLARAHLLVLEAIRTATVASALDPFAAFVAGLSAPTLETPPEGTVPR